MSELPFVPERVLAVGAHPDDVEFSAGGTLLRLRELGASLSMVVCTDGSQGGRGHEDAAGVRREEQERAAKLLGVDTLFHLPHRDGELQPGDPLLRDLVRALRVSRPDLVLGHDPSTWFQTFGPITHMGHSDHRAAGGTTLDAVYPRAGSPNFYPEQLVSPERLEPWRGIREVWLFDGSGRDLVIDVSETFERKLAALAAHGSQAASAGGMLDAARAVAALQGSPERPAEAFRRLRLR